MIATNTLKDKSWRGKTSPGKSWSKNRETEQKLEQKTKRERKDLIGPGIRSWERKSWSKWERKDGAKNKKGEKEISPGQKQKEKYLTNALQRAGRDPSEKEDF